MALEPRRMKQLIGTIRKCLNRGPGQELSFRIDVAMRRLAALNNTSENVDLFMSACRECRSYDCLALAAIHFSYVDKIFTRELVGRLCPDFWDQLLLFLGRKKNWTTIHNLFRVSPHGPFQSLLNCLAKSLDLDEEGMYVFEALVERSTGSRMIWLKNALTHIIQLGSVSQLRFLLFSSNQHTRQAIMEGFSELPHLADLVEQLCLERYPPESWRMSPVKLVGDHYLCLSVACEAGVFSSLQTPRSLEQPVSAFATVLGTAVRYNQPDLVRFLYSIGATTNREIYQLSRHPLLRERLKAGNRQVQRVRLLPPCNSFPSADDATAAREIAQFLSHKAARPRSLEKLALLEVSRLVDWGHFREINMDLLDIWDSLKCRLKFKHKKSLIKPFISTNEE